MRLDQIRRILDHTLVTVDPAYRGDANETQAMARQLEYFFSTLYDVEYPESRGRAIVPVNYSVPSGATSHTYVQMDQVGEAGIVSSYAEDIPLVDEFGKEYSSKIISLAVGFFVSIQDLRSAAMLNRNIDARKSLLARQAMERKLDKLFAIGDTATGITGFANNSAVPLLTTGITGTWSTATSAQILADIEIMGKAIYDSTKGTHGNPDNGSKISMVLPPTLYSLIASRRMDTFHEMTILQYVLKNSVFIGEITSWGRLETAGATSNPRIVGFDRNPNVCEAIISQDFEILPMQPKALGYMVPSHLRFGGTVWRYPLAGFYNDTCGG